MARRRATKRDSILTLKTIVFFCTVILLCLTNWFVHQSGSFRSKFGIFQKTLEQIGSWTAEWTDSFDLTGRDMTVEYAESVDSADVSFGGIPKAKIGRLEKDLVVLKRDGFFVGYSLSRKHPYWALYKIDKLRHEPPSLPRPSSFQQDPEIPSSPRHSAYSNSGYDRGHLVPNHAIATRLGRRAQLQTFFTTNIAPQRPDLNQGAWQRVEQRLADILSSTYDTIWVIVGTIPERSEPTKLKSGIAIPRGFYQIAYTVHENRLMAFALMMEQGIERNALERLTFCTIDELEEITGLDFLPDLPQNIQDSLEGQKSNRFWPTYSFQRLKVGSFYDRYN